MHSKKERRNRVSGSSRFQLGNVNKASLEVNT